MKGKKKSHEGNCRDLAAARAICGNFHTIVFPQDRDLVLDWRHGSRADSEKPAIF